MPYVRGDGGDAGGSSLIVFPTEHMRNVATQIMVQAGTAQLTHDTTWQQIQQYVYTTFDPKMQETVIACLKPYAERVRAAYDWQLSLATALFDAADQVDKSENVVTDAFVPGRGPY